MNKRNSHSPSFVRSFYLSARLQESVCLYLCVSVSISVFISVYKNLGIFPIGVVSFPVVIPTSAFAASSPFFRKSEPRCIFAAACVASAFYNMVMLCKPFNSISDLFGCKVGKGFAQIIASCIRPISAVEIICTILLVFINPERYVIEYQSSAYTAFFHNTYVQ